MGKTEKGAIWLDEKLLSAYDYWQFWRNSDDRDVEKFLKFFTEIDVKKIQDIKKSLDINELKKTLANETTKILHGKLKSSRSEKIANDTFKLGKLNQNLPTNKIDKNKLNKGLKLLEILVTHKIMNSKSEARRAIINNGIKINDELINDENRLVELQDFKDSLMKISFGKKKHYIFKII